MKTKTLLGLAVAGAAAYLVLRPKGLSGLGEAALLDSNGMDLSRAEDLAVALMHLISLEEHAYFSGQKTSDPKYLAFADKIREARRKLMRRILPEGKGNDAETWCMAKHLLGSAMRMYEVGCKYRSEGNDLDADDLFGEAYRCYQRFCALCGIKGGPCPCQGG
jgi:hypothetical protein